MTKAEQARLVSWRLTVLQRPGQRAAARGADVPPFRHLPQDVLQMEAAACGAWGRRRWRPPAPAAPIAAGTSRRGTVRRRCAEAPNSDCRLEP